MLVNVSIFYIWTSVIHRIVNVKAYLDHNAQKVDKRQVFFFDSCR